MTGVEYLDLEDLLGLVRMLGAGPVRDVGLLDSAAARPRSQAFGQEAYKTLPLKAAALLHSLVGNHALVDGNERLGWLATVVFLDLNGSAPGLDDDAAFALVVDVAAGSLDVEDIAFRLVVVPG
ncbi:type II toxin-antitoxin system death-on-curing family toxin [Trujillonella endophytica]|uniref:Death on curing protein n=1 Tax=Trujillonella endophytica TaxID=673521 RepID=A0A1H8WLZ8_9ACTN|nr:Fic family protein [Trujillella endophytica]SEP28656.1 death on curing protein [Trujillella endophytica]